VGGLKDLPENFDLFNVRFECENFDCFLGREDGWWRIENFFSERDVDGVHPPFFLPQSVLRPSHPPNVT
jgi:hypothetical protein